MATYGTQKVLAGTRSVRHPDPRIKGTANEFGLYQWSAFDALLVNGLLPNGTLDALAGVVSGDPVDVLVFTTDIPVVARAIITDVTANLQFSQVCVNVLTTTAAVSTSGVVSNATITEYGQVLTGYAGAASDVLVTGFPLLFSVVVPGAGATEDAIHLSVLANSAVINGVIGPIAGNSITAPIPVILASAAYTQAIKDNNNILQLNSATPQYQVVGLFQPA